MAGDKFFLYTFSCNFTSYLERRACLSDCHMLGDPPFKETINEEYVRQTEPPFRELAVSDPYILLPVPLLTAPLYSHQILYSFPSVYFFLPKPI